MIQQSRPTISDVISYELGRGAPIAAQMALGFAVAVTKWHCRYRTRKALKTLPDHLLADVGLSRDVAYTEARRPFWRV